MKNVNFKTGLLGIFMALMIISVNTQAQDQERPRHPQHEQMKRGQRGEHGHRPPRIPNLTEEQKEQMKSIRLSMKKEALPIRNEVREKEARLQTLTTSEEYNERAVNNLVDEIGGLKTDLHKLRISKMQEVKALLTEEQLVVFNNHLSKKPRHREGKRR